MIHDYLESWKQEAMNEQEQHTFIDVVLNIDAPLSGGGAASHPCPDVFSMLIM